MPRLDEWAPPPPALPSLPKPIAEALPSTNTIEVDTREVELVSLPPIPRRRSFLAKAIFGSTFGGCLVIMALAAPRLLRKHGEAHAMPAPSVGAPASMTALSQSGANAVKAEGTAPSPPAARAEDQATVVARTTATAEAPRPAAKNPATRPRAAPGKAGRIVRKAP